MYIYYIFYAHFLRLVGNVEIPFVRSFNIHYLTTAPLHNSRHFGERTDFRKQNIKQFGLTIKHNRIETKVLRIAFCRYYINAPVTVL